MIAFKFYFAFKNKKRNFLKFHAQFASEWDVSGVGSSRISVGQDMSTGYR